MPDQMRDEEAIVAAVQSQRQRPGALLPILHDIPDSLGYVPSDAVPMIAKELNLSRAEVYGVISFYHRFYHRFCTSPPGNGRSVSTASTNRRSNWSNSAGRRA
jgi:NADH:ubiquinone oxidoreductase subunit E